ncbi:hypothetical protein LP7551_01481 [Roseibium album]|nr:hypothetical protein LP7551_01481 [Roseibium album]
MANLTVFVDGDHYISCLQLVDGHLRNRLKDQGNVRWIAIGLHDALYALLIEKLTRTDGFGIYNKRFEKEVGDFYKSGKDSNSVDFRNLLDASTKQNLAGIAELLRRANLSSGVQIKAHESDIDNLNSPSQGLSRLKQLRDYLIHPRPMIAGYYHDWLLNALFDTLEVIREVAALPGNTSTRHDHKEAEILLNSIAYYLARWQCSLQHIG